MNYFIVPQVRRIKGEEVEVPCKLIKIFPTEDKKTGETRWLRLVEPFGQVLLADRRNPGSKPIKVKLRLFSNGKYGIGVDNPPILAEATSLWHVHPIQRESAKPKMKLKTSSPTWTVA